MRYLPLNEADRSAMLAKIGAKSIDDLFKDIPEAGRLKGGLNLPAHAGELEIERKLSAMAAKNRAASTGPFFVGGGAYKHHVPASVDHLIQRGEFLTSYTPYQPEISQGTLQYLFEFQSHVANLTGMDVANASLYDGSTGCGEAVLMARRVTRRKNALLSGNIHPQYAEVCKTLTNYTDDKIKLMPAHPRDPKAVVSDIIAALDENTSCVIIQNPDFFGHLSDLRELAEAVHANGSLLVVVVTEIVSLGAVMSPGEMGADIVVGEGQSIGVGLNFGGPYLGLFATNQKYVRQMPGRLCGETVDADGKRGYVLTLSTREQHIRREKATSNICTNSGLCALAFTIHMTLLGEAGLRQLAMINHTKTLKLRDRLAKVPGVKILTNSFFNEITVELSKAAAPVVEALASKDILAGIPASRLYQGDKSMNNLLILAATEIVNDEDIEALATALAGEVS